MGICLKPLCIVTDYCEKGSLWSYIQKHPLKGQELIDIVRGIAAGMLNLHREVCAFREIYILN